MGEYFKPLKRKLGVVTLVMACVFAGMWVRSLTVKDQLVFYAHKEFPHKHNFFHAGWIYSTSGEIQRVISYAVVKGGKPAGSTYFSWRVPYWSIVLPLTLLSAWLLHSKSRAKLSA